MILLIYAISLNFLNVLLCHDTGIEYCNERASVSVCEPVCLSARVAREPHTAELHQILAVV